MIRGLQSIAGRDLAPLVLAAHPETPAECVDVALVGGINGFFFYDGNAQGLLDGLATALRGRPTLRDDVFLITGTEARDIAGARADLEAAQARLGVRQLDLFLLLYVAPADDPAAVDAQLDELARWRQSGLVRHIGVSAHSRPIAARYATDTRTDALMHRYNMAHRGAEESVLGAAARSRTPVIAFTCTRWGTLLAGHAQWAGAAPTAADCYRFALARPEISAALSAPHSVAELRASLDAFSAPPMDAREAALWRRYGDLVYGDGASEFETRWP